LPVSRTDLTGLIIVYVGPMLTSLEEGVRKPGEKARSAAAARHHPLAGCRRDLHWFATQGDHASFPASTGVVVMGGV
jgi:hypothetical protein